MEALIKGLKRGAFIINKELVLGIFLVRFIKNGMNLVRNGAIWAILLVASKETRMEWCTNSLRMAEFIMKTAKLG